MHNYLRNVFSETSFDYNYFESILVQNSLFPMVLENYIYGPSFNFCFIFTAEVIQLLNVVILKILLKK